MTTTTKRQRADADREWEALRRFGTKAASVIATIVSLIGFAREILEPSTAFPTISGAQRMNIIIIMGGFVGAAHGILWSCAERSFRWDYGAGGGGKLPSGLPAVVLSLTLTIPLVLVPFSYQRLTGVRILLPDHWIGAVVVLLGGAAGHLLMYGVRGSAFRGLRSRLMPPIGNVGVLRAIVTEAVYAAAYFGLVAIPYRVLVATPLAPAGGAGTRILFSSLVFVTGMATFIIVRYPQSLKDPTWVQVRGFLSGLLLPVCLCGAMYL